MDFSSLAALATNRESRARLIITMSTQKTLDKSSRRLHYTWKSGKLSVNTLVFTVTEIVLLTAGRGMS